MDANTWASQFMIFYRPEFGSSLLLTIIISDFTETRGSIALRWQYSTPHSGGLEWNYIQLTSSYRTLARVILYLFARSMHSI